MCGKFYFHEQIPQSITDIDGIQIAHFEMIAVKVALKLWATQIHGIRFKICCDNQAVVSILNTGISKDHKLQQLLREVVFL